MKRRKSEGIRQAENPEKKHEEMEKNLKPLVKLMAENVRRMNICDMTCSFSVMMGINSHL